MSRRRRPPALVLALASVVLAALVATGCGSNDSTDVTLPTISVEQTVSVPTETGTTTTTESTPTESQNGGIGAVDPNQPDSQANDKPPAPGSPEAAFEKACKQNPAACG